RVSVAQVSDSRNVSEVTLHAEHSVDDQHLWPADRAIQPSFEMRALDIPETNYFGTRERRSIHHARVIELVDEKYIARSGNRGDDAEVGLVSGRKYESGIFADEFCELDLETIVKVSVSVEKPAAG